MKRNHSRFLANQAAWRPERALSKAAGASQPRAELWPYGVVKSLDIGENSSLGVVSRDEVAVMDQITFQAAEEILSYGIVVRGAFARHTLTDAKGLQALANAITEVLGLSAKKEEKEETAMKGVRYIGDFGSPLAASMLCEVILKGGHTCEVVPYKDKWGVLVTRLKQGVSLGGFVSAVELLTGCYNCVPEQKK